MVTQGYTATLVATTLAISRSSLYYRKRPRGSRADRTYDEQIVVACGEKLAYGYRRVAWWLQRTAYHHPEGNSYIERFHRSLKEEEVWTAEYRSLEEARASIARWIEEYNHDRPHRGVGNRTPHEAFLAFAAGLKNEALTV
jgi:integrase-like protein